MAARGRRPNPTASPLGGGTNADRRQHGPRHGSEPRDLEAHLAVNLFGTYGVTRAFLPALERSGGALGDNVSMMALAPFPVTPAYAVSKAAAFNLTQSLRGLLAPRGVSVHAILTGPTDTDMARGYEIPKATPESVAQAILDGLEAGEEETFPNPLSAQLAVSWRGRRSGGVRAPIRPRPGGVKPQQTKRLITTNEGAPNPIENHQPEPAR